MEASVDSLDATTATIENYSTDDDLTDEEIFEENLKSEIGEPEIQKIENFADLYKKLNMEERLQPKCDQSPPKSSMVMCGPQQYSEIIDRKFKQITYFGEPNMTFLGLIVGIQQSIIKEEINTTEFIK